jgi:hypothetical protein
MPLHRIAKKKDFSTPNFFKTEFVWSAVDRKHRVKMSVENVELCVKKIHPIRAGAGAMMRCGSDINTNRLKILIIFSYNNLHYTESEEKKTSIL